MEELADIVEVVYGILQMRSVPLEQFEALRLAKKEERAGSQAPPSEVRVGLTVLLPVRNRCC